MGRDGFNKTASEDLMHVSLIFKLGSLTNVIENSGVWSVLCWKGLCSENTRLI